jgi:hypothetical protein
MRACTRTKASAGRVAAGPAAGAPGTLAQYLQEFALERRRTFAVLLRLSQSDLIVRRPSLARVVRWPLQALAEHWDARVFTLANHDVLVMCRGIPVDMVDTALAQAKAMVDQEIAPSTSPLARRDPVSLWFDLMDESEYAELLLQIEDSNGEGALSEQPLSSKDIATLLQRLVQAPIATILAEQTALCLGSKDSIVPLFREIFVPIDEIKRRYVPGADLFASTALFHFLTETFDRSVLVALSGSPMLCGTVPVSLNLNLPTLATEEFARFRKALGDAPRPLIEIRSVDIVADFEAYAAARDSLRRDGYRFIVDRVTPAELACLDLAPFDADFVKLVLPQDEAGERDGAIDEEIGEAIRRIGRGRCILARVETDAMVQRALHLGIANLQGRYIDNLIRAMIAKGMI